MSHASSQKVEETEVDLSRNGETRRVRVRASRMETGGAVLTFDDISRLVAAQRNAAWKDVARRIAHEIKNPLTPIQLSAERLRRKYRDQVTLDLETFDRCTETIIRQVGDIGRMVDEFSTFARMPVPNFAQHDLTRLVRETVFTQRVARPEIGVELVSPVPEARIVCDDRLLVQAIGNVLKNAGEAIMARQGAILGTKSETQAGSPSFKGQIRVEMITQDENIVLSVEDNGIGLPAKDRDRLTEPYVTTREKGTGLGLAIVKRIIEDHKGEFVLSDAMGLSGARATIRLPLIAPQTASTTVSGTELNLDSHAAPATGSERQKTLDPPHGNLA